MSGSVSGRDVLVSGNWKMHHNHYEAIQFVQKFAALARAKPAPDGRTVSLHPPFTSLRSVQTAVESDAVPVALGAQTCHMEDRGAFTGEVSAEMLAKLNVRYVIAGHSERRAYCGETDSIVRAKLDAILRHQMVPILCVGETLEEREAGGAADKVVGQLQVALGSRKAAVVAGLVIAYEPIWAIGTGQVASADDAQEMAACIRDEVERLAGATAAERVLVQYGGSVTPDNAAELLACPDVDGLLVGGASLDADKFSAIARAGS
ncbi:MAG TPA: triose-phosphate isomerase [Acidimicrobiales bacterium]|jgi:triosephosphate isomerase|nr:triose-phosphate isomerase [Acidimicrobiales bacterium]